MESLRLHLCSYVIASLITFSMLILLFSSLRFREEEESLKVKLIYPQAEVHLSSTMVSSGHKDSLRRENVPYLSSQDSKQKENRQQLSKSVSEEVILKEKIDKLKQSRVHKTDLSEERSIHEKIAKLGTRDQTRDIKGKTQTTSQTEAFTRGTDGEKGGGAQGAYGGLESGLSKEYLFLIKRKLQNNFEVPIYLRTNEGLYALVRVEISAEGKILDYKFLKKSNLLEFDLAVERCLKISSPLPVNKPVIIMVEFRAEGIGKVR